MNESDEQACEHSEQVSEPSSPAVPTRAQQRRAEEMEWLGRSGYTVCCGGGRGRQRRA